MQHRQKRSTNKWTGLFIKAKESIGIDIYISNAIAVQFKYDSILGGPWHVANEY